MRRVIIAVVLLGCAGVLLAGPKSGGETRYLMVLVSDLAWKKATHNKVVAEKVEQFYHRTLNPDNTNRVEFAAVTNRFSNAFQTASPPVKTVWVAMIADVRWDAGSLGTPAVWYGPDTDAETIATNLHAVLQSYSAGAAMLGPKDQFNAFLAANNTERKPQQEASP